MIRVIDRNDLVFELELRTAPKVNNLKLVSVIRVNNEKQNGVAERISEALEVDYAKVVTSETGLTKIYIYACEN